MAEDAPRLAGFGPVRGAPDARARIELLTRVCLDDMFSALGLRSPRYRRLFDLAFGLPARRLARQMAAYDAVVGESGLAAGGAWALNRMVRRVEVEGRENLPTDGPLILVSNHPGLSDVFAVLTAVPRPDLRVVAAEWPLLGALPNTRRHLLLVGDDPSGHFRLVRAAARHLRRGGALLSFPAGRMEPDPTVMPGAAEALSRWSDSVDLFARLVPELVVVPAAVGGVFSPLALRNPLTRLRRREEDRRWLASNLQMLVPALRDVEPKVIFGQQIPASEDAPSLRVLEEMRRMLLLHEKAAR